MNWDFWAPTLIGVAVNALFLAFVLGKLFGKVDANANMTSAISNRISEHEERHTAFEDKLNRLANALTAVTATCAAYFATNPSTRAADALRETLKDLEKL